MRRKRRDLTGGAEGAGVESVGLSFFLWILHGIFSHVFLFLYLAQTSLLRRRETDAPFLLQRREKIVD